MIQINLLPDIKAEYVKAQRSKRTVITMSAIVIVACLGVIGMLASIAYGAQNLQLSNEQNKIEDYQKQIESNQDLDKVLTVQSQLLALTPLHESKPVVARIFTYMQQTTPNDVRIDTYDVDFETGAIRITGNAPSLEVVNKYIDTLKFTEIAKESGESTGEKAFSSVVLSDFSKNDKESTYTATLVIKPELFSLSTEDYKLLVPKIVTTRSETQAPNPLFTPNQETNQEGQ